MSHPLAFVRDEMLELLESRRFGVEYQPLVSVQDQSIFGYEALARFWRDDGSAMPPQLVFDALHRSPLTLIQVEQAIKLLQLRHAPAAGRLFLNLDPDALTLPENEDELPAMFAHYEHPERLVVEIIENSSVLEAERSMALLELLSRHGIRSALDDVGSPASMVFLPLLARVNVLKFDRSWLLRRHDARELRLLGTLLELARKQGQATVLEGVETEADLAFARELGVDYAQGFLYRPLFQLVRG